jgi:Protein of unknown function (DUF2786)
VTTGTIVRRIQALLDKAASTSYPAEAEALLSKAQELMTRHAIDEASLESSDHCGRRIVARELTVDVPYAGAKTALLGAVLRANGCRLVFRGGRGPRLCTLVGHESDLDHSLALYQVLSLQALRAMLATRAPDWEGVRSFRHAFLLGFAARIGQRLREAADLATQQTSDGGRTSNALVLANRRSEVDDELSRLFPNLGTARRSASSGIGAASGRAAADRASLGRTTLPSSPALPR